MAAFKGDIDAVEKALIDRIKDMRARFQADDPRSRQALLRIALLIENQAKVNIRKEGLIDTGNLLNSIRSRFFMNSDREHGVEVGSFAVPYAAIHEFGFKGNVQIPEHQRRISQVYGRSITPRIVDVRSHSRNMDIPARPYLKPAAKKQLPKIIDIIRELARK